MGRRAAAVLSFGLLIVAARAVPAFAAPELHASAVVDDSAGDNNGVLEPGESAFLVVTISNAGDQDATTVAATVSTSTVGANVTDAGPKTYGTIAANDSGDASFGISLDSSYVCGTDVAFDVAITSDQGPTSDQVTENVPCPAPSLEVSKVSLADASTHDAVAAATVGETVDVSVQITNSGTADATNVTAHLSGTGANVTQGDASYGTIAKSSDQTATFQVVPTVCPQGDSLTLDLTAKSDQSTDNLTVEIPIDCKRLGISFARGTFDDRVGGNGDGVPQPGETGLVFVQLFNGSDAPVTGIQVTLDLQEADVSGGPISVPDIAPGTSENSTTAFTVKIHDDAPLAFGSNSANEPVTAEPSTAPTPSTDGGGVINAPPCVGSFPLSGFSLDDGAEANPFQFEGTPGILERGTVHVTSDQGEADFIIPTTVVCGVTLAKSEVAATGGIRFDLMWLALGILACGAVLRRASAIKA